MAIIDFNEIIRLVGYHLGVLEVQGDQRLAEDLGAESADIANIVASLEEKYHIKVNESEIAKLFTPQDIFELLLKHLNEN